MIFSLFWEGAFIRMGRLFEGAFILKSEILGGVYSRGRLFEAGRLFEEIRYVYIYIRSCYGNYSET